MVVPPGSVSRKDESTTTQAAGKSRSWRVLYLFAGPERHADIRFHLKQLADSEGIGLCMEEFDILRDKSQDLSSDEVWEALLERVMQSVFHFIILAPPCNTFSRARHNQRHPGPKPLRLLQYPRGFPWLKGSDHQKISLANLLVDRSFQLCKLCVERQIGFLLEHPEQLGLAQGTIPAAIWNFSQFSELEESGQITQAGIFQCVFGAPTSKPTRLATSAKEAFEASPFATFLGPHVLDADGRYLGPLPGQCPHKGHDLKLIGKDSQGNWNTGPSAAYPPEMCKQIAVLIQQHLCRFAVQGGAVVYNYNKEAVDAIKSGAGDENQPSGQEMQGTTALGEEGDEEDELFHGNLQQAAADNAGLPMTCRWQNRYKSFSDGGGLNSPGRWAPEDRGVRLSAEKTGFVDKLALVIRTFIMRWLPDVQRATFRTCIVALSAKRHYNNCERSGSGYWEGLEGSERYRSTNLSTCSPWKKQ